MRRESNWQTGTLGEILQVDHLAHFLTSKSRISLRLKLFILSVVYPVSRFIMNGSSMKYLVTAALTKQDSFSCRTPTRAINRCNLVQCQCVERSGLLSPCRRPVPGRRLRDNLDGDVSAFGWRDVQRSSSAPKDCYVTVASPGGRGFGDKQEGGNEKGQFSLRLSQINDQ